MCSVMSTNVREHSRTTVLLIETHLVWFEHPRRQRGKHEVGESSTGFWHQADIRWQSTHSSQEQAGGVGGARCDAVAHHITHLH